MSLLTLDLLNEETDAVEWLELQLVSEDLTNVIAELLSWRTASDEKLPLSEVLGTRLPQILESGLDESDVQALLRHPRALTELQEEICFRGGPHWQNLGVHGESGRSSGMGEGIPPNLDRVLRFLEQQVPESRDPVRPQPEKKTDKPRRGIAAWTVQLLALVCLVGFSILLMNQPGVNIPAPQGQGQGQGQTVAKNDWALNDLGRLNDVKTAPEYLEAVANAMNDWNTKPPTDSPECVRRIREMIEGCHQLIADSQMERSPLDAESRKWLHTKCTAWIEKFNEELAAVTEKPETWSDVTTHMNAKIDKAVSVMRQQANKLRQPATQSA